MRRIKAAFSLLLLTSACNAFEYPGLSEGKNPSIYMADIDAGGGTVRGPASVVTPTRRSGSEERSPSWSPDGKMIAFKRERKQGGDFVYDLVVRSLETGAETTYPPKFARLGPAARLTWLHDGNLLTIVPTTNFLHPPPAAQDAGVVLHFNLKSGESKPLLKVRGPDANPTLAPVYAVAPDDKTLYVADNAHPDDGRISIIAFDLPGLQQRSLFTLPTGTGEIRGISLSPDGRMFAIWTTPQLDNGSLLFRIGVDGSGYDELYTGLPPVDLVWTKDSRAMLIGSGRDKVNIMRVSVDGPAQDGSRKAPAVEQLTGLELDDLSGFDLSPDGSHIIFGGTNPVVAAEKAR